MYVKILENKLHLEPGGVYTMVGEEFSHEQSIAKLHLLQIRLQKIVDKMLDCNELSDNPEDSVLMKMAEDIYDRDYRELVENYSLYKIEFFSELDKITIPPFLTQDPWVDQSWHNDACPSFFHPGCEIVVWVDYDAIEHRDYDRCKFTINKVDVDADGGQEYADCICDCETLEELMQWLETATI